MAHIQNTNDLGFQLGSKLLFSLIVGGVCGVSSSVLLISLVWVIQLRDQNPDLMLGLPLAGLFIGWLYDRFGGQSNQGHQLVVQEMSQPRNIIPFRMAPLVWVGTVLTHLFGGSAGREGTAIQMGASLSDQFVKFFNFSPEQRQSLLLAAVGSSFGAAVGAPWAGVIFGLEIAGFKASWKWMTLLQCLIASFVAYAITIIMKAPHAHYAVIDYSDWNLKTLFLVFLSGLIFGLTARFFMGLTRYYQNRIQSLIQNPPIRTAFGGLMILFLFYLESSYRYVGLGIPWIEEALVKVSSFKDPLYKIFFTSLTVGSGFKGGEFIPLVFIGTTLGSALGGLLSIFSFQLMASVGFAAVFAGASKAPWACTVMAMEIFGPSVGPFALVACWASVWISGPEGIYKTSLKDRVKDPA